MIRTFSLRLATILVAVVLLPALGPGCDKDSVEQQRLTRSSDKPAVVLVGETETGVDVLAEVEPNNEVSQAQLLNTATAARGILEGSDDIDRYQVVPQATGLLFVDVSGGAGADLMVSLHDAAGDVLAKSDRGPTGTSEGLAGFGVEAGKTYQVVVGEFVGRKLRKAGGRQGPSGQYQVSWRVEEDAEAGFEREPNEELSGASEIRIGEERRGFVGWAGDKDLWRLPITGFGEIVVDPEARTTSKEALHIVLSPVPGVATRLALLDPAGNAIVERATGKGEELALRNFLPEVGVDSYTIRIGGKSSNPEESYVLRVDIAEVGPGTEEEPNDTQAAATPVGVADSSLFIARGELVEGDVDYFQLAPVTHDRILELRLSGPAKADLDISVVAESGAILGEGVTAVTGESEVLSQVPVGQGLSPLLKVHAKKLKGPAAYELSLSLMRGTAAPPVPPRIVVPNSPSQLE